MTIERALRLVAGVVILASVGLSLINSYWLVLTAFAGLNLLQSAFTNWCSMIPILGKLGLKPCVSPSTGEMP